MRWRRVGLLRRQGGRQGGGHLADVTDGLRVLVHGVDVEAFAQEVHEIATAAAAGIEQAHARPDATAEQLIEQVDVDVPELADPSETWIGNRKLGPVPGAQFPVPDPGF